MLIKIALSGTHGTGKSWMIDRLVDQAHDAGIMVMKVPSPTRDIKALGFTNNKELTWDFEWMLLAEMRKRQLEVQRDLLGMASEPWNKPRLIIAERCTLDMLSYMADFLDRNGGKRTWDRLFEEAPITHMRALYELGREFALGAVVGYWDRIYYKPPHPDYLPEADPDRLGDREYQLSVDNYARQHCSWAKARGVDVQTALQDRIEAAEDIWSWVEGQLLARR